MYYEFKKNMTLPDYFSLLAAVVIVTAAVAVAVAVAVFRLQHFTPNSLGPI